MQMEEICASQLFSAIYIYTSIVVFDQTLIDMTNKIIISHMIARYKKSAITKTL